MRCKSSVLQDHGRSAPSTEWNIRFKMHTWMVSVCHFRANACLAMQPSWSAPFRVYRKSVFHYFVSAPHVLTHRTLRSIESTTVNDVKVENKVGDAIVQRIIRAHQKWTPWKCCIVIPLLPGFPLPVEHSDASPVSPRPLLIYFLT